MLGSDWSDPTHYEPLSHQPILPRNCWCPTSLQLLKAWRASWLPPQRKWGLCKLSRWVGNFREIVMLVHLEEENIFLLLGIDGCWSSFVAAVRYSLCAGPYHRQWCLQSSCCRVCSAGPQPHWCDRWPWLETLHVCNWVSETKSFLLYNHESRYPLFSVTSPSPVSVLPFLRYSLYSAVSTVSPDCLTPHLTAITTVMLLALKSNEGITV